MQASVEGGVLLYGSDAYRELQAKRERERERVKDYLNLYSTN